MNEWLLHWLAHWLAVGCMVGGNMLAIAVVVIVPALILYLVSEFFWKRITTAHDLVQLQWMIQEMRRQGRLWTKAKGDEHE